MTDPIRIAVAASSETQDLAHTAADFCERGDSVRIVPLTGDRGIDAVLTLSGPPPRVEVPQLYITDSHGAPPTESEVVARTLAGRGTSLEVVLRDQLGSALSRGVVTSRRTRSQTVAQMMLMAGPLLVMAAGRFPLPRTSGYLGIRTGSRPRPALMRRSRVAELRNSVWRATERGALNRRWAVARVTDPRSIGAAADPTRRIRLGPWQEAQGDDFWADPFVLRAGGRVWLFVEELQMATGRGVIRVLEVTGDAVRPGPIVHRTEHHLSFPQVYATSDGWLATVETCASHNPILEFDEVGQIWRESVLPPLPSALADPVLEFDGGGGVCGVIGTDARVDPDSVFVRFRLADGRWRRVDADTRVDVRTARGGGTLDVARQRRASQDCAGDYGAALSLTDWPTDRVVRRVGAQDLKAQGWRPTGTHTLTWTTSGDEIWCDGWHRRITPRALSLMRAERAHLDSCTG